MYIYYIYIKQDILYIDIYIIYILYYFVAMIIMYHHDEMTHEYNVT